MVGGSEKRKDALLPTHTFPLQNTQEEVQLQFWSSFKLLESGASDYFIFVHVGGLHVYTEQQSTSLSHRKIPQLSQTSFVHHKKIRKLKTQLVCSFKCKFQYFTNHTPNHLCHLLEVGFFFQQQFKKVLEEWEGRTQILLLHYDDNTVQW